MDLLNAINPLDSFNKGLKIMFYVQTKKKSAHMKLLCHNPYVVTNINAMLGERNGLSMRLKVKTPGNNEM